PHAERVADRRHARAPGYGARGPIGRSTTPVVRAEPLRIAGRGPGDPTRLTKLARAEPLPGRPADHAPDRASRLRQRGATSRLGLTKRNSRADRAPRPPAWGYVLPSAF